MSNVTVLKPPMQLPVFREDGSVFLAGSIEMGVAEDWQTKFTEAAADFTITILNPRRDDWDSSWEQTIENDNFRGQVEWELDALNFAETIVMYFDPNTKSPISLLELGLYATSGKLMVCCPEGFWRKGNVDVVCQRYGIPTFDSLEELIDGFICKLKGLE